jgi:hypothetical protein
VHISCHEMEALAMQGFSPSIAALANEKFFQSPCKFHLF